MGQPKGLIDYRGKPWLIAQLYRLWQIGLRQIVLVLGYEAESYRLALAAFQPPEDLQLSIVQNRKPAYGPFSSLLAGFQHLSPSTASVFFLPLDVPCPNRVVWLGLMKSMKPSSSETAVVIPSWHHRGGHPVLLSADFLQKLLTIPPGQEEARLDRQIKKLPEARRKYLEVSDPKIHLNLNTAQDFIRWKG